MVQIIQLYESHSSSTTFLLYIPHGSDNTLLKEIKGGKLKNLYIPHGSDNTDCETNRIIGGKRLYIPHGSDNTSLIITCLGISLNHLYIPHGSDNTFLQKKPYPTIAHLYIPHGSDNTMWDTKINSKEAAKTLYPTWFR